MGLPFVKPRTKRRDQIVSVDLGGRTTKAVSLQRKGDKFVLLNYAILDAPQSEKSFSAEELAEHLKEVFRVVGGRTKQLTLAISAQDTIFRQLEMPLMPVADMRKLLKFNSKNYLQQDMPDYVFDCCYLVPSQNGGDGNTKFTSNQKQKVVVGAIKNKLLNELQDAVRSAGLIPDQVVPGLIGPINAFEMAEPEAFSKEVVGVVELGYKNTIINILDAGEVRLNRVIAFGGDKLTSGLTEAMGISYTEAENIKVGMTSEIQDSLEMLVNPLGRELRASIDFFEHQHDKPVSQVFMSGSTARNEIILQALQAELMVPCKAWNPTRFLEIELPTEKAAELEQVAPQLSVAVGAAAAGF